jgi:hypothetical protein
MNQTRRKEIIEVLEKEKLTVKQLADLFQVEVRFILEDLRHISQSLKPMHKKIEQLFPVCNSCGFVFRSRKKFSRPSKCPKCRSEDITEPVYWIKVNKP